MLFLPQFIFYIIVNWLVKNLSMVGEYMIQHPINPIEFDQYEKISDDIFSLGNNAIIRFSVQLARYNRDTGERSSFHSEYGYHIPKKSKYELLTIRRSYDYFMTIENIYAPKNNDIDLQKAYIRIGPSEFMNIKFTLNKVLAWFNSQEYANLYAYKSNELIMRPPIPTEEIQNMSMGKWLRFEPCVITRFDQSQECGVRIFLSDENNYVDINIDKLMGLIYTFSCFNMIQSAQLMINYLQRPEFGSNYTSFVREYKMEDDSTESNPNFKSTSGISGRKIKRNDITDLE